MPKVTQAGVSIYVPVLLEVTDHLVVGVGPVIGADFYSSYERYNRAEVASKTTLIGNAAIVGGWF
jgi:hypothetical protein